MNVAFSASKKMTAPLISILLPTRNRLDLAKAAIETVCRQSYENWEVVVSDNNSRDDYQRYIDSLGDNRIVYTRSCEFISVTENWNNALKFSTGDYIIMIGDDDGLTPDYFQHVIQLITGFNGPDLIYHGAYHYTYPRTLNSHPQSKLTDVTVYSKLLQGLKGPQRLAKDRARWAARQAVNMKAVFAFNMQHFLFNRFFISRIEEYGPLFQGPFPDFYAANMALLLAENIVVDPRPLTIIGISPKSYGHFYFNRAEKEGAEFLNSNGLYAKSPEIVKRNLLPGTNMNSSWLVSVSLVKEYLGNDFADLKLGILRYRLFQMNEALQSDHIDGYDGSHRKALEPLLHGYERKLLKIAYFTLRVSGPLRNMLLKFFRLLTTYLQYNPTTQKPWQVVDKYQSLLDVYNNLEQTDKAGD